MKVKRDKQGMYRLADNQGRVVKRNGRPADEGGFRSALDAKLTLENLKERK